ncbi:hypothetical protein A1OO_08480 [Enterovibrio norvegicus FF-33]|uniref:hypothetical protein n=1 Tax=Enterovibrio norvegicus TaxID=188144 RepID=UPI0002F0890E|nr:hypothetical protein [Enterovibrio norvegicus]OEE65835.1 hypothetical protein A1OO_08480 [Enterovibrio norvegicus FF-33]
MDNSVGKGKQKEAIEREALCDEIDTLMDLMLVEGELSDGTKIWIRRTLMKLVSALGDNNPK